MRIPPNVLCYFQYGYLETREEFKFHFKYIINTVLLKVNLPLFSSDVNPVVLSEPVSCPPE